MNALRNALAGPARVPMLLDDQTDLLEAGTPRHDDVLTMARSDTASNGLAEGAI